jgi:hypothetical protein
VVIQYDLTGFNEDILSGNQPWQVEIQCKWRLYWEDHVQMVDFPLPCLITGRFIDAICLNARADNWKMMCLEAKALKGA